MLITGEGANFCAGGDVHTFLAKGEQLPAYIRVATAYLRLVATGLIRLNAPVVSAVHGYAAGGGGMGLVCASDFVVAAQSAKFLAGATTGRDGSGRGRHGDADATWSDCGVRPRS